METLIAKRKQRFMAKYVQSDNVLCRGRAATGSRGSDDPPLFQVRGPHMDVDPPLFVRISWCMNAADNTFKLSDQWICDRKCN